MTGRLLTLASAAISVPAFTRLLHADWAEVGERAGYPDLLYTAAPVIVRFIQVLGEGCCAFCPCWWV